MIFGFDISTSYIGYTVLDNDGKFFDINHLDLTKIETLYLKGDVFKKFLKSAEYFKLDKKNSYFIEEPLMAFKANASMAHTIAILQRFNAICSYQLYELTKQQPIHLNVISARSKLGCSVPRGTKPKPFIFDYVKATGQVPDSRWAYKKTGTPKDWCYDQADSFVIAKAGIIMHNEKKAPA